MTPEPQVLAERDRLAAAWVEASRWDLELHNDRTRADEQAAWDVFVAFVDASGLGGSDLDPRTAQEQQ